MLIAPYKTPEREQWLDFTMTPFFKEQSVFFIRPGSGITWDGRISSLYGKRIGMVPAWSVGAAFEAAQDRLSIDYASTIDLCFRKLLADRVEMVPTSLREATAAFRRLGLSKEQQPTVLPTVLSTHLNYFGFSKRKQNDLSEFKRNFDWELTQMVETGEITEMLRNSYGVIQAP